MQIFGFGITDIEIKRIEINSMGIDGISTIINLIMKEQNLGDIPGIWPGS